jgi:hypothetical protein
MKMAEPSVSKHTLLSLNCSFGSVSSSDSHIKTYLTIQDARKNNEKCEKESFKKMMSRTKRMKKKNRNLQTL